MENFDLNIKLVENCCVYNKGTGTSCKGQLANKNFQTGFVVAGGEFFFLLELSTN